MNTRILELAEQATLIKEVTCEGYQGKPYTRQEQYFDKQKFAEKIVTELVILLSTSPAGITSASEFYYYQQKFNTHLGIK